MAKRGLGRGLGALIQVAPESLESEAEHVSVYDIIPNPRQPRLSLRDADLEELVASVRAFGILQPLIVRPRNEGYELVAGERRLRAAKKAGLEVVPVIVRDVEDEEALEIALVENLQREDLNAVEEARGYRTLMDEFGLTQEEVAAKVGKGRATVANALRLLKLPTAVLDMLRDGELTAGHARAILSFEREEDQIRLAERVVVEGLSVREVEKLARLAELHARPKARQLQPKAFKDLSRNLTKLLGTRVRVRMGAKKGKIEISFTTLEDLERLYATIEHGAHSG